MGDEGEHFGIFFMSRQLDLARSLANACRDLLECSKNHKECPHQNCAHGCACNHLLLIANMITQKGE